MIRKTIQIGFAALVSLALAGCCLSYVGAAKATEIEKKSDDLFPLTVGTSWVYVGKMYGLTVSVVGLEVTGKIPLDGKCYSVVAAKVQSPWSSTDNLQYLSLVNDDYLLHRMDVKVHPIIVGEIKSLVVWDPAQLVIKNKLRDGQEWRSQSTEYSVGDLTNVKLWNFGRLGDYLGEVKSQATGTRAITNTVLGREKIQTYIGEFEAYKVRQVLQTQGGMQIQHFWFAPGFGLVGNDVFTSEEAEKSGGAIFSMRLADYSSGGSVLNDAIKGFFLSERLFGLLGAALNPAEAFSQVHEALAAARREVLTLNYAAKARELGAQAFNAFLDQKMKEDQNLVCK